MSALEQIVRPYQNEASAQVLPQVAKVSPPVIFFILAGQGVKSFQGTDTATTTVYVKKYPKEKQLVNASDFIPGGPGFLPGFPQG